MQALSQTFDLSRYKTDDREVYVHTFDSSSNLVAFEITFIDGSKATVIMTKAQRSAVNNRKDANKIKSVGGLGHRKLKN